MGLCTWGHNKWRRGFESNATCQVQFSKTASAKLEQLAGGDFSEYLERLEFLFTAHDIGVPASEAQAAQADRKKFVPLISSLSKEVYSTLRSLCLPNSPADKTFQQVCDLLKGYYKVQTSTTTASFAFRNCVQKPAECLIDFSSRLKRASVPCGFGEHLDRAPKDQFVASLCDHGDLWPVGSKKRAIARRSRNQTRSGVICVDHALMCTVACCYVSRPRPLPDPRAPHGQKCYDTYTNAF